MESHKYWDLKPKAFLNDGTLKRGVAPGILLTVVVTCLAFRGLSLEDP